VLDTLERRPNIAAKLRQSVRIGDDRLTGEGEYWQQGSGNQRRTRWELKTLVAGETAFITQVYDGEAVWTDRQLPATRRVTRVEMSKLRRELATGDEAEEPGWGANDATMPELIARGGLSQLVAGLHESFSFGQRQTLQRGDQTVFAVIGQWRSDQLERVWPGLSPNGDGEWPAHLPHHVMLYIDVDDRFPYFVEYRGAAQAYLAASSEAYTPAQDALASFEFIDVQFASPMPADRFQYTPPENNFTDITDRVVAELRPTAGGAPETSTARRTGSWR
jgi:hypothetical protein